MGVTGLTAVAVPLGQSTTVKARLCTNIIQLLLPGFIDVLASLVVQSVIYGVYLVSLGVTMHSLLRRWDRRLPTIIVLTATLTMFVLATYMWTSSLIICANYFNFNITRDDTGATYITDKTPKIDQIDNMRDGMFMLAFLVGDGVLAWRTLALVNWHRWVISPFVITLLMMCGLVLADAVIAGRYALTGNMPVRITSLLMDISWCLSILLNIACICLLSRIAWSFRKAATGLQSVKTTPARRALYTLVTIGTLYIALSLPRIVNIVSHNASFRGHFIRSQSVQLVAALGNGIPYQLVCLFPTMVTAVIYYESAVFDMHRSPASNPELSTIHFAGAGPEASAIGTVPRSRRSHVAD